MLPFCAYSASVVSLTSTVVRYAAINSGLKILLNLGKTITIKE